MKFVESPIRNCFELEFIPYADDRGAFVKTFQCELFAHNAIEHYCSELYYSLSHQGVLRGFHFQIPPQDHAKLVFCVSGQIIDAVIDLRKGSPTFGHYVLFDLSSDKGNGVYIPSGLAHGFLTVSKQAIVVNNTSTVFSPAHERIIRWDTAGIPWPVTNPIVSTKDKAGIELSSFLEQSPFQYEGGPNNNG